MIDLDAALDDLITAMERINKTKSFKGIKRDAPYKGRGQQEYLRLRGVADVMGIEVVDQSRRTSIGRAHLGLNKITLDYNYVGVARVELLAHELAHFVLHDSNFGGKRQSHKLMEVEAGAVAYLITRALGYNLLLHAANYCLTCAYGRQCDGLPKIKKSRERILAGARSILEDLAYSEQHTSTVAATVAAHSRERQHQHK